MSTYHLFDVFGIELEYMIVDRQSLDVRPIADQLLTAAAGSLCSDYEDGAITWSNELAMHVIELKTTQPVRTLGGVAQEFQASVKRLNAIASQWDAMLLPTGMHPWMNPFTELKLWPHDSSTIYEAFNRIFNCRGHGWANLQSMHINLPFAGEEEFGRLHAAIRLLLPLLPGLACSSPIADGRATGYADYRMEVYRQNSQRIPQVAGVIVPEAVFTKSDYEQSIYEPMFQAIAPFDPDGILQEPFLNARGAIARFDRGSIEIRVIDTQEHPHADLAIAEIVVEMLQTIVAEKWQPYEHQRTVQTENLAAIFRAILKDGERTIIADRAYLQQFGLPPQPIAAQEVWRHLINVARDRRSASESGTVSPLEVILNQGSLSRRILERLAGLVGEPTESGGWSRDQLRQVYREIAHCLEEGLPFQNKKEVATPLG